MLRYSLLPKEAAQRPLKATRGTLCAWWPLCGPLLLALNSDIWFDYSYLRYGPRSGPLKGPMVPLRTAKRSILNQRSQIGQFQIWSYLFLYNINNSGTCLGLGSGWFSNTAYFQLENMLRFYLISTGAAQRPVKGTGGPFAINGHETALNC